MLENIKVSPGPHISKHISTRSVMLDVLIGLLPAFAAGTYFFRLNAIIITAVCVICCCLSEFVCNLIRNKPNSLGDLSAVVTGVILAFSLPPSIPYWVAIIGSVFCIVLVKMVFGGLGSNVFNPAMAGRAFLAVCFGTLMTTWSVPATLDSAMPIVGENTKIIVTAGKKQEIADAVTKATPLAWVKDGLKKKVKAADIYDQQLKAMCLGETAGCIGETSATALVIGGIYLLIRKTITYHIPLAVLVSAYIFAMIGHLINPEYIVNPFIHLVSGGMLICAFFIATDPVTAPLPNKGMFIFGAGLGLLIMLIRTFGAYPEGVMYAVLLMNALTPLIDRFCKLIPVGGRINA